LNFIHTADIHIGAFPHTVLRKANLESLEKIVELALSENVKNVIVAGDLFETPRLGHETTLNVVRIIKKGVREGLRFIVTPGSHDLTARGHGVLSILGEVGLVHLTKHEEKNYKLYLKPLEVDGVVFYGLPGLRGEREVEYLERRKVVYEDYDENKDNILIAHTGLYIYSGIDISKISPKYSMIKLSEEAYASIHKHFKYLALGHIHFPIPYSEFFEGNVAYPGSPIGRDANDIYETYILKKKLRTNRRVLLVNLRRNAASIKALTNNFGIDVEVVETYGLENVADEVKRKIRDMNEKYRCIIVYTGKISIEKYSRVRKMINDVARSLNAWVHIVRSEPAEEYITFLEEFRSDLSNIEELEKEAIEQALKKFGLKLSPEIILNLISTLGREYSEGMRKTEINEEVADEAFKILEQVYGELKK